MLRGAINLARKRLAFGQEWKSVAMGGSGGKLEFGGSWLAHSFGFDGLFLNLKLPSHSPNSARIIPKASILQSACDLSALSSQKHTAPAPIRAIPKTCLTRSPYLSRVSRPVFLSAVQKAGWSTDMCVEDFTPIPVRSEPWRT